MNLEIGEEKLLNQIYLSIIKTFFFFFLQKFSFFVSVRSRLRRQHSATAISPQRPCTAASNLSKSRPESSGVHINDPQKQEQQIVR
jgi:hypothetical protein